MEMMVFMGIVFVLIGFIGLIWFGHMVYCEVRNWIYIKEYRRTNEWNVNAPEYLKHVVIPNEEYKG